MVSRLRENCSEEESINTGKLDKEVIMSDAEGRGDMRACLVGERGILFSGEPSGNWYETRSHAWNRPLWGELSYCLSGDGSHNRF